MAKLKFKVVPKFLASIFAGIGTAVRKDGLATYVDLDYSQFAPVSAANASLSEVAVFNETTGVWGKSTVADIASVAITTNSITNAKLAQMAAKTIKLNATSGAANATDTVISSLTDITTPNPSLDWLLIENHTTGTLQKVNPAELTAAITAGVTTFAGRSGVVVPTAGDYLYSDQTMALPRQYISGLGTANNIGTPTTDIDIETGICRNSTDTTNIKRTSAITKRISTSWAVGTGNGMLDTGSIASGVLTTYHLFVIRRSDTGVVDVLASLSPTAPTLPANYDTFRRIASVVWTAGNLVRPYHQNGNVFTWDTPINDRSATTAFAFAAMTISVPSGIVVQPLMHGNFLQDGNSGTILVRLWDATLGASTLRAFAAAITTFIGDQAYWVSGPGGFTNTSAQVWLSIQFTGSVAAIVATPAINTNGWIDTL